MREPKVFRALAWHKNPLLNTTLCLVPSLSAASISAAALSLTFIPVRHHSGMGTDLSPLQDLSYNLLHFLLFRTHSLKAGLS